MSVLQKAADGVGISFFDVGRIIGIKTTNMKLMALGIGASFFACRGIFCPSSFFRGKTDSLFGKDQFISLLPIRNILSVILGQTL